MTLGGGEKCIVYVEDTKLDQFVESSVGILLFHRLWRIQESPPEHAVQSLFQAGSSQSRQLSSRRKTPA